MSAHKTASTGFSKMEQTFLASSTFKRNKRYLNIQKINGEEQQEHLRRRKPRKTSKNIQAKISRSFSNSTAALTDRVSRQINKFKSRCNSQERPQTAAAQSYIDNLPEAPPPKTIKGVGIGQHLSREQYYKVRSKPVKDERLFNNFYIEKPDQIHMADLGRGPQRNFDNSHKHININIEYNTQKLFQDYYYKPTTMDCRTHYKKQKQHERYFFNPKRQENKPSTDLSPKAVKKSAQTTHINRGCDTFYMNSGRQLPCNFDQRVGTTLSSHWRNRQNIIERPHPEYSVRRMKQKMIDQRKDRIADSKKPHFDRGEICDKKYFIIQGETF